MMEFLTLLVTAVAVLAKSLILITAGFLIVACAVTVGISPLILGIRVLIPASFRLGQRLAHRIATGS